MYKITYTLDAEEDLRKLKKSDPASFKKAVALLNELIFHPTTGTGHPHRLVGNRAGQWSRSISKKHRLVYQIQEQEVLILVLAAYGHYDDK
ncbi:MAG: Txe/YoeB family addiction module toxin [Bacteroides sp.]|nr:Txe/YoeB family addiction module toxin [Ruminococcus flavefaciens]MCM1554813.1 Txe/YoeB family addiction module toxin [Bacteroides sp.]